MDTLRRLPAIAAACFTIIAASEVRAEVQIGDVRQPEYKGAIGQLATGTEHQLIFSEPVYAEETVLTGAQSSTALQFLDQTQLRVGMNSRVKLDRFIYDPGTGTGDALLNFGTGAFRYVSGSLGRSRNMQLATPTAVLSIRGTDLIIAVGADGTTQVAVLDGEIEVVPCGGEPAVATTGYTATVTTECTGVTVTLGLTVPEDPTLFADLNDMAPAAGPSPPAPDEFSDQTHGQTANGAGDDGDGNGVGSGSHTAEASSHSSASNDDANTSSDAHAVDNEQDSSSNQNDGTSSGAQAGADTDPSGHAAHAEASSHSSSTSRD